MATIHADLERLRRSMDAMLEIHESTLKSMFAAIRESRDEFRRDFRELKEGLRQDLRECSTGINQKSEIESDSPKHQLSKLNRVLSNSDLVVNEVEKVKKDGFTQPLVSGKIRIRIFPLVTRTIFQDLPPRMVDVVIGLAFDNCISDTQLFDPGGTNCVNDCGGLWYKQAYWCHGVGRTLEIGKKISPWLRDRACIRMRLMDPSLITHCERILKLAQRSHGMVLQEVMSLIFCLGAENISLEAELKRKLWCCGFHINEVIAENIDSEEMQGLKAMFANIDTNNSGTITYEELKAELNKLGSRLTEGEVKQFLDAGDVDGNGSIDYIEVITATMHRHRLESDENLDKAFLHFDKVGEWVHNWDRRMKLFAFEHEKRKEQDKKDLQDELAHVEFLFRITDPECTDHASHVWQLWCHNTLILDRLQKLMMISFAAKEIDVTKRFGEALASVAKVSQSRSAATVLSSPASVHVESRLSSAAAIASRIVLGLFEDSRYKFESKKPSLTSVDIAGFGTGHGCSIELMKFDMSGSAAVLGSAKAIAGFYEVLQQNETVLKFGFLHQHVFMYSPRTHGVWDPGGILLN